MKRTGYLFEKICSKENIRDSILEASKNKRKRIEVRRIIDSLDFYVDQIHDLLINKRFKNSEPSIRTRFEKMQNKVRTISVLPFYPDHIIQHAIIRVIAPLLKRGMYYYCSANIPGRGEAHIRRKLKYILPHDIRNTKYCLKFDIKQFYPSISTYLLKQKLRKIIKDEDALWLLDTIIDLQPRGLPLGSYCSQWLANFYLQDLDHFIKEKLYAKYMFRYADDIVILDSNKRKLKKMERIIEEYLFFEYLEVKSSWRIFEVNEKNAIDFLGYKFYRKKITIRKRIYKNIRRCILRMRRKINCNKRVTSKEMRSLMSYYGYIKNTNSFYIRNHYLELLPIQQLKLIL